MSKVLDIVSSTASSFDSKVQDLSKSEYKEALQELIANLESRLDCVNEELEDENA